MEAANLGARYAVRPDDLDDALAMLATVPSYHPSIDAWVHAGLRGAGAPPGGADTLGIPTWHYGHEPPNPFATAIAKYFRNSTREAILLEVCDAGIVFLPGRAGTVQEIFQDACENYYADESAVAPMVLVDVDVLDRGAARRGRSCSGWRGARRWSRTCTSSRRSRRRRTCWFRGRERPGRLD